MVGLFGQQVRAASVDVPATRTRATATAEHTAANIRTAAVAVEGTRAAAETPTASPVAAAGRGGTQAAATKRPQERSENFPRKTKRTAEKSAAKKLAAGVSGRKGGVELVELDSEIGFGSGGVLDLVESAPTTAINIGSDGGLTAGDFAAEEHGFAATEEFIDYSDSDAEELMPVGRRAVKPPGGEINFPSL